MPVIRSSGVSTRKNSQDSGSVSYTVDMSTIEGFF